MIRLIYSSPNQQKQQLFENVAEREYLFALAKESEQNEDWKFNNRKVLYETQGSQSGQWYDYDVLACDAM